MVSQLCSKRFKSYFCGETTLLSCGSAGYKLANKLSQNSINVLKSLRADHIRVSIYYIVCGKNKFVD